MGGVPCPDCGLTLSCLALLLSLVGLYARRLYAEGFMNEDDLEDWEDAVELGGVALESHIRTWCATERAASWGLAEIWTMGTTISSTLFMVPPTIRELALGSTVFRVRAIGGDHGRRSLSVGVVDPHLPEEAYASYISRVVHPRSQERLVSLPQIAKVKGLIGNLDEDETAAARMRVKRAFEKQKIVVQAVQDGLNEDEAALFQLVGVDRYPNKHVSNGRNPH